MTDQNTNPNPEPTPPSYHDWREQRRAERQARREAHWQRRAGRPYGWFAGMILVILGIIFLLQNLGITTLVNWWALFILIPAYGSFVGAWNIYQDNGRVTRGVASSITVGLVLTVLALIFLLNLAIGLFWPILLIIGGLALLLSVLFPEK